MVIYTNYAQPKVGLEVRGFTRLLSHFINTPLSPELFWQFDTDHDGYLTFAEFLRGMDLCERGTFEQKVQWAFEVYDLGNRKYLDIVTLRELLKRSYSAPLIAIEKVWKEISR
jgi:Ca2+-binding EF-hand superfamily protein